MTCIRKLTICPSSWWRLKRFSCRRIPKQFRQTRLFTKKSGASRCSGGQSNRRSAASGTSALACFLLLACCSALAECRPTPAAAVESALGREPATTLAGMQGTSFEVWRTEQDAPMRRQWIWIRACDAAGPALITWVPLSTPAAPSGSAFRSSPPTPAAQSHPLVRQGDRVVVVESGKVISMRLAGRAMEAGGRGAQVRVRITAMPNGPIVSATVSGKDEVSLGGLPEEGSND